MSRDCAFGVIGGYGATGRVVVSELARSADAAILIGGRDLSRARDFAAKFGGRAQAGRLDIDDKASLDAFCARCSIVIHCAGPVSAIRDRVAQAAWRSRSHYVDLAGLGLVREALETHRREIADAGLTFAVSAGWMPGITELLPVFAHARAKAQFDLIESVSVYYSDSGDWSHNALHDGAAYLRREGLPKPGYYRKGLWAPVRMAEASRKVDVGEPFGKRRFSLLSMPESSEVGLQLGDCDLFTYTYLAGVRNAIAAVSIALLPLSEALGVRLMRNIFRRNRLAVEGFAIAHAVGTSRGRRRALSIRILFQDGLGYWVNGLAAATTARMIAAGTGVRAGVHYLAQAVDAGLFMAELEKFGLGHKEVIEECA
jgi:hypothetical protein